MSDRLKALADAGVSIWLDDLSRERLRSGNLEQLVAEKSVVGVTTNPSIFSAALGEGDAYDEQLRELAGKGVGVDDAIFTITTDDVRDACDVLRPAYDTNPADGRVSIEVDPGLARDTEATIAQAKALWASVDRTNALIKIPATEEGLPAITAVIAEGINVNVTLIFSIDRYRAVMDAYMAGLEKARDAGLDLSTIHSVGSFFVSRVDSEIDDRLDKVGTDEARALKGKAAVANARLAYAAFTDAFSGERWESLAADGAQAQRPLWASTGVKNPDYPDTLYVTDLVVADTVNTMPEKTLEAFADHGEVEGDKVTGRGEESEKVFQQISAVGVDLDDVYVVLEDEGVAKFDDAWAELTKTVKDQLEKSA
ncbi:transaldolase [uncultured Nocardioides sp.]|uniref:transaldolase n=1 Tax=uncultured Nocardioides sp. TaxID=198441 RepID=UPI002620E749|nr:transaldolase [uncultured Nocardioides sp.]